MSVSVEDVVRTSDDAAVRARFDAHNLVWLPLVLLGFTIVTIVEFGYALKVQSVWKIVNATANFFVCVFGLMVVRDVHRGSTKGFHAPAQFFARHVSAILVTYIAVQYLAVIVFASKNFIGWAITVPLLMVGFRLLPAELLLLHGYMVAVVVARALLGAVRGPDIPEICIITGIINGIVLAIGLLATRRLRREISVDWTNRRAHAREQLRMRDELQYARELQLSMLPEGAPQLDWLDLAGVSVPATEVGGDYYDYFVVGDRIAVVSGDVAGHGMASGIVLSALRSGFTLLRESLDRPAEVMQRLHELVAQTSRRRMLATAAVLLLDPKTRRATLASAGHPPLVVRRNGSVETIELFAPPLGVRLPTRIPEKEMPVASGDVFVMHTDGVYESRNESGEFYGLERLANVVASHDGSAAALRDAIVRDVDAFRGTAEQADDVTVVVARVR